MLLLCRSRGTRDQAGAARNLGVMRLFVAINVPKKEKDRIQRASRAIREADLPVRWVEPDNFHLTLKFLGEVRPEQVPDVEGVLERIAGTTQPFDMEVGGFGAFPTIRRPRVLWVGIEPSPALRCLKQDLEWALTDYGFERETRAFHPHLTLGRAQADGGAGIFRGLDEVVSKMDYRGGVKVRKLDLMQSHLSRSGAKYTILKSAQLKG